MLIGNPEGKKILPHIQEALGSNLSSETGYHGRNLDFPPFLQGKP
jgi:hypothetical protein